VATKPKSSKPRKSSAAPSAAEDGPLPLIHNPVSGSARGGALLKRATETLAHRGITVEPVATGRAGHATELARDLAKAGHGTVLVLGGDGTLSEAANGVLGLPKAKRPTLGFLPGGTGNDFLRDFAITDLHAAVHAIAAGRTVAVDAVDVRWPGGTRFSINLVGSGLAAKAGARFGKSFRWVGPKGYDVAAAVEIATMRACPTTLVLDGKDFSGDLPLVIAMNSVHTGGAMRMAPDAKPTDGLLDVVTVQDIGKLQILNLLATKVRKGDHVKDPHVTVRRAAKVHIEPQDPSPILLDGDIVAGTTPLDLTVLPGAFRLLA
jgi:diacylglycerol kinase (ATP)